MSTKKIEDVISHLGIEKISASYVSSVAQDLDSKIIEFLARPVESHTPYLFVDASYFKIRDGIRYSNKSLLVIAGVNEGGIREILSARIADCEDELTWEDLFSDLKDRGLQHVDMVISDGHKGIQRAVERSFHVSSWQIVSCSLYQGCIKENFKERSQGCRINSKGLTERSPKA